MSKTVTFKYLNHRGVIAERTVDVEVLEYVKDPGYDYKPGWFISGRCHTKGARRSFALDNIITDDTRRYFILMTF